ncbi:hypothetical protein GGR51DRAFT_390310 [Nemania sp. FL0031]|nr:hypothetical protein GGR51DRAFT_390310 [Nemania sp. FL0031]
MRTAQMETGKPGYEDFIHFRGQTNPCITGLVDHIRSVPINASKVILLDYPRSGQSSAGPMKVAGSGVSVLTDSSFGKFIFIEDIEPQLMSYFGETLDIDPLFFSGHTTTDFKDIENGPPPPSLAFCPSQIAERGYLHIHYQQVLDLGNADDFKNLPYALKTDSNTPRNVRRLPSLSGRQLALARGCCSILLKRLQSSWICMVLTDPPVKIAITSQQLGGRTICVGRPLHGGFENFAQPISFSDIRFEQDGSGSWDKTSILDSLLYYLRTNPPGFTAVNPTILSLGYYPMRIILAEWVLYILLMSRYLKYHEYSLRNANHHLNNTDITELQRWSRRSKQSRQKLFLLTEFIRFWLDKEPHKQPWRLVLRDIRYLDAQIRDCSHSMEQMIPVATSIAQLLDARQSMRQTANITRLTYIALVFVPLSWVCGLFSMSEPFSPGQERFWVYFVTALPLLFVVLLLSALPNSQLAGGLECFWGVVTWWRESGKQETIERRIRQLRSTA